jgi:hypothetical protein
MFYEYNEATERSLMDGVDDGTPVFPSTPFWPMSIIPKHLLIAKGYHYQHSSQPNGWVGTRGKAR